MEHKTLTFEVKAIDYTGRTLEGFAAAFGNLDQVGDVIHPGAFRKTLAERGQKIKFLWQHDPTEPIGKLIEAHEEPGGLFVKAIISDTQRGRDALALLKDGAIGEMSIGYDTVKGGMDYTKDAKGNTIRNLREIKLYEFSLVTFPANEQAVVTSVKQDVTPEEAKPWRAVRNGDKWNVYKLDSEGDPTGESLGEHDSEAEAQAQVRALYASEADKKSKKSLGTLAESQIHSFFTNFADTWYGEEKLTREERIILSSAIGDALSAFVKTIEEKAPQLYIRQYYDENPPKGGGPVSQRKVGRTISAATLAKLKAARDVIDELCNMGMIEEETEEDEDENPIDKEVKSATIIVTPDEDQAVEPTQSNSAAGPVRPPTEMLLRLIDLELSDLHH